MKKILSIGSLIYLLAGLLTVSCTKETVTSGPEARSFKVSVNADQMKTTLDGKQVLWKATDKVACLSYEENPAIHSLNKGFAPISIDGKNAEFEITTTSGMQPRIILNPSADGYAMVASKNALQVEIPSSFEVEAGKVADTTLYSAGIIGADGKATMKNLFSYFKVEIESSEISKLRISSIAKEGLSGKVLFDLNTLEAIEGENNTMSVTPKGGAATFTPGVYYIPVPAGTLEQGLMLKFYKPDGSAAKKISDKAYSVPRNKFINLGKESEMGLVYEEGMKVFDILFSDGTTVYFPFSDKADAKTAVTIPSATSVIGKKVGPYYLVGKANYPFYFAVYDTGGAKSYFIVQASYGMRLGGTKDDHILLPPVKDFKLTKVYIKEGSQTRTYCITDDPASGVSPTLFTDASVSVAKNTEKTFNLKNTKENTAYRFAMSSTNPSSIMRLTATYEAVD